MSKSPLMSLCRHIAGPVYRLLFPATVYGIDNIRELQGKAIIIVSNHHSYHDPLQLIVRYNRNLHFLAKKELFQGPFGWFFNCLGLIKIDRQVHGQSLEPALDYLSNNQVVAIFPEGTTKHKQPNELLSFRY
ncbi:MAG: lysophospholipid acyltransferase family protein, partial [Candidatus Saccharibacteria bacterium]|nr:lysophospholipid acyltransferase family protein [Candidatus Saccharibacteria bacterium]